MTSALSFLSSFFTPVLSIIVLAITVSSPENWSIWDVPEILIPFDFIILLIILFALSFSKKALQVIDEDPSYILKLINVFPVLNSLESISPKISPSIETFPSSAFKSAILINCSVIFIFLPNINGVSSTSSSVGNSGKLFKTSTIVFAITVTSPTYVSNPAFPTTLIPGTDCIFTKISFPSSIFLANDLHVIVPVPSYKSIISIPFPVFVSLHSEFTIIPSNPILPSFAVISFIFNNLSLVFVGFPIMYSPICFSSSVFISSSNKSFSV